MTLGWGSFCHSLPFLPHMHSWGSGEGINPAESCGTLGAAFCVGGLGQKQESFADISWAMEET